MKINLISFLSKIVCGFAYFFCIKVQKTGTNNSIYFGKFAKIGTKFYINVFVTLIWKLTYNEDEVDNKLF